MNSVIFDSSRPIDSLVQFTNRHLLLSEEKKLEFIADLEMFLSTNAFEDKSVVFDEAFAERFTKYDLPNLYEVLSQLKIAVNRGKFLQITANLSSISRTAFLPREAPNCYQARIRNHDIWGWIPKEYVDQSEDLKSHIVEPINTVVFEDLSPSILFGMQRLSLIDESSREIDLSLEVIAELSEFALQMQCIPLMIDLMVVISSIINNEDVQNELEARGPAVKIAIEQISKHVKPFKDEIKKRTVERPFVRHAEENEGSRWFDPTTPYRSIIRFTGRCNSLSIEEQNRFFSAVRHFFTIQAYNDQTVIIPSSLKSRIIEVDIPFMLKSMQLTSEYEKNRVLSCMQIVTKLQLSEDTFVAKNSYGIDDEPRSERVGWMGSSNSSSSSSKDLPPYVEIPIRSKEFYDFFGLVSDKALYAASTKELIQILHHAIDTSNTLIRESVLQRIKKVCQDPQKKQKIIDHLISHLDDEEMQNISIRLSLLPLTPSDPSLLVEDQLFTLCMFNLKHAQSIPETCERCLQGSAHFFTVIDRILDNVAKDQQTQIREYCQHKALELIPCKKRKYNHTPQREAISSTFDRIHSSEEHTIKNIESWLKHYISLYDLETEDFSTTFVALSTEQASNFWRLAGRSDVIDLIKKALLNIHPALLERTQTPGCMAKFFPELAGQNSDVEKLVRFLFKEAARSEEHRHNSWKEFAKDHPFSDAELIRFYEIIEGNEFKEWFDAHAPQGNCMKK